MEDKAPSFESKRRPHKNIGRSKTSSVEVLVPQSPHSVHTHVCESSSSGEFARPETTFERKHTKSQAGLAKGPLTHSTKTGYKRALTSKEPTREPTKAPLTSNQNAHAVLASAQSALDSATAVLAKAKSMKKSTGNFSNENLNLVNTLHVTPQHVSTNSKSKIVNTGVFDDHCCPICIEDYSEMEWRWFPCPCGYRICSMCVHLIRGNDSKCPQCREIYDEKRFKVLAINEVPPYFKPLTTNTDKKSKARAPTVKVTAAEKFFTRPTSTTTAPIIQRPPPPPPPPPAAAHSSVKLQRFSGGISVWD